MAEARAQAEPIVLSLPSLHVEAGAANVTLPISLTSAEDLTQLAFDVIYWPPEELCAALVAPDAITVRSIGRTAAVPEEDYIDCELGRIRIVVFDLIGRTLVPSGTGPVFELALGDIRADAGALVHFGLRAFQANHGPELVGVSTLNPPGACSLTCPPDEVPSPCRWGCRPCSPGETCDDYNPATLTIGEPPTPTATSTTLPASDVRCCVSPGTCLRVGTAAECEASGGRSLGPGPCDPDPCATGLPAPIAACPGGATEASVRCRLGELIAMVAEVGTTPGLGNRLLGPLHRAEGRMRRVEQLRSAGRGGKVRTFLRRAARDLGLFQRRLRSRRTGRLIGASVRAAMLGLAEPLGRDLRALVPTTGR